MKKTIINNVKILFTTLISILLLYSCTEEFDYGKSENAVKTLEFSDVLQTTAMVSGKVITDNGASLSSRGICYSINNNPTISGTKTPDTQSTLGSFTCALINLAPSTTYFARAYATNGYGTAYGNEISFTTQAATIPIISSTTAVGFITQTTAVAGGTITNSGASNVTSRGVCFSKTNTIPTITDTKTNDGTGIGQYSSSLTNLTPNTLYYIRAYATNGVGTAYGDVKSFTTTSATIPVVSITTTATFITQTTAISGGNVTSESGATVTSRGVCWSNTTTSPTILNSKTVDGTGLGTFTSSLTGLSANTTYYVRAYATNSVGTAYGPAISVRTLSATIPTGVTTNTISSITQTTATSGGNISNDGGASVTSRGVCWSNITSSPTITNSKTVDGSGIGSFTSSLSGLTANTTYYVRAYATNSAGTSYGSVISFTTLSATIPTGISTTSISSISQNTASSGGTITGDGGASITSHGVCWSSSTSSPTIFNSTTDNGSGIGSFTSSLTGLTANTTYYVRAYSTNSVGTAYGNTISFITLPNLSVGQSYQGGIIAYIFVSGDSGYIAGQTHGLIATTSNQSAGAQWGCSGTSITGTSTTLGTGLANTSAIIGSCSTTTIAAALCNNLSSGGYTDWYLPSYTDLTKLYLNQTTIGGFSAVSYWSSSQASSTTAYSINFSTGTGNSSSSKSALMYVRAIRKF
ncbi:beta strand repeat-containing protein [Flavobacterium cellulosilyticum]|uniref:DUF1566 domain-containing protein n=1 Tax=Flavobacterium cellulosilyticum TaxID=2541731 RepID=A0A4V2Z029_9FLAO|nr:DUF1566 domain-containing protein [Flavobacterium cellulosilyticum]TDD99387.1 DUF1566 domain-containing protein [Flavobacterium cellulosilyticum]